MMNKTLKSTAAMILMLTAFLVFDGVSVAEARIVRGRSQSTPAPSSPVPQTEIILEAGMVEPFQDLADDFWTTDKGLSQTTGYELGVCLRQYLSSNWAITPSFHYVSFGNATGVGDFEQGDELAYNIQTDLFRYGVDLNIFAGPSTATFRPYLIGGAAFVHYRYEDSLQYNGTYQTSFDAPAFSAGLGFKMRNIELSGTYHFAEFDTDKLKPFTGSQRYYWNHVIVRIGIAFGN